MKNFDSMQRFLFEDYPIRGQHVSLDESWQQIVSHSELDGRAQVLLGEALAATALLVETLKIKGSVILQIRGTGPLGLLVVEANSNRKIRGIARQESPLSDELSLPDIFGSDYFVITIKVDGAEPYQGIAPLIGNNLAEALEHYFATSDQLPTRFWLSSDTKNVSGLMLQKLPGNSDDPDAWNRALILAETLSLSELKNTKLEELLYRLFHEENLRVFPPQPVEFYCSCSRERTAAMLITLGKEEVLDILNQEGAVSVNCEFCNRNYRFDSIDVEQVFLGSGSITLDTTAH